MDGNTTVFISRDRYAIVHYRGGQWFADAYYGGEWGGSFCCDGCVDLWSARQAAFQVLSDE